MPRIFGENLFDDFMNDFAFPDFTDSANIEKALDRKSTRLNSSHKHRSRMPSSA